MIAPWLTWVLTLAGVVVLAVGGYLLGRHHGYTDGFGDRMLGLPVDPPWSPPTEADFLEELHRSRLNQPPEKYRKEP